MKSAAWHIITSEYPPQFGGVSDYTQLVAAGLASAGDEVHVWCPSLARFTVRGVPDEVVEAPPANAGGSDKTVVVHRELGAFSRDDLRHAGSLLDQFSQPRRLLVQWVPHGYGYRSMNLPFCLWLRRRALQHHDRVELMVHEPYLAFGEGSWKQAGVAAVHRLMTAVLMQTASRVWMSIPAWEERLRPYAFGRALEFSWLPVTSNIPVVDDSAGVKAVRDRYATGGNKIVGHFGTYDRNTTALLLRSLPPLLGSSRDCNLLLLGHGSEEMRAKLIGALFDSPSGLPSGSLRQPAERVHATARISANDISLHLSACDVLLQPFVDGVSSRRTAIMAGLAHGVAIVTNSGRLTEPLWAESEAVALVQCTEPEALVKATLELLADESGRDRLSDAGKGLYNERFAVERTVAALRAEVRDQRSEVGDRKWK